MNVFVNLKKILPLFIILLLLSSSQLAYAQNDDEAPNLVFTHLSPEDGLSDTRIMVILQDHQGFMWIGTQRGGLNRYDGYEFTVYKSDRDDESSISNNFIWSMFEDSQNNLWVGTNGGGLNLYDRATDSFIHYPIDESGVPYSNIKTIAEDADGTLWLGGSSASGFSKFNRETGEFFHYQLEEGDDGVRDIHQDRETGLLWLGTYDHGILLFDSETEEFVENYPSILNDTTTLSSNFIHQITQRSNGDLWVTTDDGLNRFNRETETFTRYANNLDDPSGLKFGANMFEDSHGRFWVTGGGRGLNLYHPDSDTFTTYVHDPDDPNSLSANTIYILSEDASGALWVGVNGGGVSRASGEPPKFNLYRSSQNNPDSLSGNGVRSLYAADKNDIWIGANGLNYFDGQTFTRYLHDPDDPTTLSHNLINTIVEDPRGGLWITTDNGLNYFDGEKFTRYMHDPDDPDSIGGPISVGAYLDDRGGLWIALYSVGMDYFDGEKFIHFRPDDDSGLTSRWPYLIIEDAYDANRVWVATFGGIIEIDLETQVFTDIFPTEELLEIVPSNQFINLYQDDSGLLWVGGGESGLMLFDPDTQEAVKHYTTSDGLADNSVSSIVGDEHGQLWVTTQNGLSQFDPQTETFRNYYVADGLQSNQFTSGTIAPDGQIFVGGPNGLNAFYPEQIQDNPTVPPVVLTDFELFNQSAVIGADDSPLQKSINSVDELVLSYDQSVFTFEFSALNYSVPERNQYAYMMEGFDDDWRFTTSDRRFATYTNLNPGNYTFRVRASNNDGLWNEDGVSLPITITPPWWQTWWAYIAYALAGIASIFAFITWRTRSVTQRNEMLQSQLDERTRSQAEKEHLLSEVQEQATRVQSIMDTVPEGVMLLDADYRVVVVNPIAKQTLPVIAGVSSNEVVTHLGDRSLVDLITSPPEGLWHEVKVEGTPSQYFAVIARSIDEGVSLKNWVVVFRDITIERTLQEKAASQQRLVSIGQFAAGIAHDFNNMLSVIILNADMLNRYADLDSRFKKKVEKISLQGRSASHLIQQILDYSRQTVMERHAINLSKLLSEQVGLISQILPENIQLIMEAEDGKYPIYGDPIRFQQIIMNLIVNARDAMPDGGQIDINLSTIRTTETEKPFELLTAGQWVTLTVRDTGTGIPEDMLPRIFEPFVTSKPVGKGTGLGLAQIFGIVKQHNGYIDVQTEMNEGTSFMLYFPKYDGNNVQLPLKVETGDIRKGNGETILLVEDNFSLQEALLESLENLNYQVLVASDGKEAVAVWEAHRQKIDIVVSDVVMPIMSGISLFNALYERGAKHAFIFITGHLLGHHDELRLEEFQGRGRVELLGKPIDLVELSNLVAQLLDEDHEG